MNRQRLAYVKLLSEPMFSFCCVLWPAPSGSWGMVTMLSVLALLLSPDWRAPAAGTGWGTDNSKSWTTCDEPSPAQPLASQLQQVSAVKNPQSESPELTWCHTSHPQNIKNTHKLSNVRALLKDDTTIVPILVLWIHWYWIRLVDRSLCRLCLCWLQWLPRRTGPLIPGAVKMLQAQHHPRPPLIGQMSESLASDWSAPATVLTVRVYTDIYIGITSSISRSLPLDALPKIPRQTWMYNLKLS